MSFHPSRSCKPHYSLIGHARRTRRLNLEDALEHATVTYTPNAAARKQPAGGGSNLTREFGSKHTTGWVLASQPAAQYLVMVRRPMRFIKRAPVIPEPFDHMTERETFLVVCDDRATPAVVHADKAHIDILADAIGGREHADRIGEADVPAAQE